ncbi:MULTISPECIES: PTS glucose transporter subunit IIA [unclassified Pseudoalteromonas]|uniref:PTS glucose transporter subunit IIA n=1 Tax=unclassified Pseudoalteromonas TaxID=194690 RepID=UPI0020973F0F|nr:PTS glucose transporter subunit IIA [Pseudoalteromonas sp. XMcav2-N]MCO7188448.1 PTS glucose transporter subunit IIA [Pseudoalteromonas sp. XMcav2-N]
MHLSQQINYAPIAQIANPIMHIASPFTGKVHPLSHHPEPLFASGMLGPGVCVKLNSAMMLAPCPAKVEKISQQGCEFILRTKTGLLILLHLLLPTEYRKTEHLIQHSYGKKRVTMGDILCYFDVPSDVDILGTLILLNADKLGPCYYPLNQVTAGKDPLITLARACNL